MNEQAPFKIHGAPLPKPDGSEKVEKMNPVDLAFHQHVLRHAKGIINLYEEWIKARNR